jgi:hypothetical protein
MYNKQKKKNLSLILCSAKPKGFRAEN